MAAVSSARHACTEGASARLVWRVPISSDAIPRNGASRTPALELPTMQAACFISSEKCANRIDGIRRNRSRGSASTTLKIASDPGSLLGAITTKLRPDAASAAKSPRA